MFATIADEHDVQVVRDLLLTHPLRDLVEVLIQDAHVLGLAEERAHGLEVSADVAATILGTIPQVRHAFAIEQQPRRFVPPRDVLDEVMVERQGAVPLVVAPYVLRGKPPPWRKRGKPKNGGKEKRGKSKNGF